MKGPNDINIADRTWMLKTYRDCFVGKELVNWIIKYTKTNSREIAVEIGEHLRNKGAFKHVSAKHSFKDDNLYYRFTSDEPDIQVLEEKRSIIDLSKACIGNQPTLPESTVPSRAYGYT